MKLNLSYLLILFILSAIAIGLNVWEASSDNISRVVLFVSSLLLVLGVLAAVLSNLQLSNHPHALGLPQGSIRAVLAISLVIMFTAFSMLMLTGEATKAQRQELSTFTDLTSSEVASLKGNQEFIVVTTSRKSNNDEILYSGKVFEAEIDNSHIDLAKQIMAALIATLAGVTGFYFGSRSSSVKASAEQPAKAQHQSSLVDKLKNKVKGRSQRIEANMVKLRQLHAEVTDAELKPIADAILNEAKKFQSSANKIEIDFQTLLQDSESTTSELDRKQQNALTALVNQLEQLDAKLIEQVKQMNVMVN